MNTSALSNTLRKLHLLHLADRLNYFVEKRKNAAKNERFKQEHLDVALPPDYLIYESFQLDYDKYYTESIEAAQWLIDHFKRHVTLENKSILDWGCGPGRIIRHFPKLIGNGCAYYGTDYNANSIKWCHENLPEINFNKNNLEAKLPYADGSMDVIYGISIFTHLSEQAHHDWFAELYRVLAPGGILFLTTQGNHFKTKLEENENALFDAGKLVVRGKVLEGHRTYSAFQPESFMRKLFAKAEFKEHIVREVKPNRALPQDIWIVSKRKSE